MSKAIRFIRCVFEIAPPSRVVAGGPYGGDWLSRWERRISDAQRARVVQYARAFFRPRRFELRLFDAAGEMIKSVDVTDKSHRNRRMRLNRWKRKASHAGMVARIDEVVGK